MTFLTILGVPEISCSFRLVLERKSGKEIPKSSRLEFLDKFLANNFALSDAEHNTSESFDNLLPESFGNLPQVPRVHFQVSVMDSIVLLAYESLAASRTLLKRLLPYLNFSLDSEDLFCWYKQKVISMNYGSSTSS